jgi:hypothetical protein
MSHETPLTSWKARAVSEFTPRPVEWLWHHRLALGKPALLEGDPDLKKSFLTLDLCARLSTGRAFPDGSASPGPANAVILNDEDSVEDTVAVRLRTLDADLSRIFVVCSQEQNLLDRFCLLAQLDDLERLLVETDARLLVIDPVVSFVDEEINWSSDPSVRRLLRPLARLAERRRCAVVLVRHLIKSGGTNAVYRGGGSIGVVASCRAAWLVGRDPRDSEQCVLAQVKNNLAPAQPSLVYRVDQATPEAPARFSWQGTSPLSASQLLSAQGAALRPRQRARDFLRKFLQNGPRTSEEIWQAALEYELSTNTIKRVKKMLKIESVRVVRDSVRTSYWLLPGQKLPPELDPASDPDSVEAFRAAWRKEYPEPTPLDDL